MEAVAAGNVVVSPESRRFYVWTAIVFVLIAFGGFSPSYWAPVVAGHVRMPAIVHVHGALLFSWTLFYLAQTTWVAAGRTSAHRAWGLAGIALFTLTICSIVVLKITMIRLDDARGFGDASRRFTAVAIGNLPLLIGAFALAIAKVNRPEVHKRLMYLLMSGMMIPAIARVFLAVLAPPGAIAGGPPPAFVAIPPAVVATLMVLVAMVYDWRSGRRPANVYMYGGPLLILSNVSAFLISRTDAWMSVARFLQGLPDG